MSARKSAPRSRFAKQPHDYSCGPTAILNTMKWVGYPATIKYEYTDLVEMCDADPDGTDIPVFDRVLREHVGQNAWIKRRYRPKFSDVERWIKDPTQIVILCYWHTPSEDSDGHYMILTEGVDNGAFFQAVNDGLSVMLRDRERIKRYIRNRSRASWKLPVAWFIRAKT